MISPNIGSIISTLSFILYNILFSKNSIRNTQTGIGGGKNLSASA